MTMRHRVLIAEDDPQNAQVLVEIVQSMDFEYRLATTLEEVRACLLEWDPCVLLQDMQIPHAAGARPNEKNRRRGGRPTAHYFCGSGPENQHSSHRVAEGSSTPRIESATTLTRGYD